MRAGNIVGFEDYELAVLVEVLSQDLARIYTDSPNETNREWQYDEFCLVSNFILKPVQTVDVVPFSRSPDFASSVETRIRERKKQ